MSHRRDRLADELGSFVKQYQRPKGDGEPADRRYLHDVQSRVRRMDPRELDEILRGEDDEDDEIDLWADDAAEVFDPLADDELEAFDPLAVDEIELAGDGAELAAGEVDEEGDGRSLT